MKRFARRKRHHDAQPNDLGYCILEIGTGYLDGWYFCDLAQVQEIARYLDDTRPQYAHKVIAGVEPFSIRPPVIRIADARRLERMAMEEARS